MSWPKFQASHIGDILRVEDGNHGEYRPRPDEFVGEGVAFIRAADLTDGRVCFDSAECINDAAFARIRKGVGAARDVLVSHKGTVGKVALAPRDAPPFVCSPQTTFWRSLDGDRLDARSLYSYLRSSAFQSQLRAEAGQTDMAPYVSLTQQKRLKIAIPDVVVQRAVADVLGSLDDKITVNRRVGAVAVELCDVEFAHLLQDSAMTVTYGEIAEISGGGTPSTKQPDYWEGCVNWATPTDVTSLGEPFLDGTSRRITEAGLAHCSSAVHPTGSILMTSRATIGAFALAMAPTATNQGFIVVNALDRRHQLWLFHEMRTRISDYVAHANGATFLELSRGKFKDLPIAWPLDEGVFAAFNDRVKPLHDRAYAAMKESRTLAALRDTLLPALMSGRLSVLDAEAAVSEVV